MELEQLAQKSGQPFKESPYFEKAENRINKEWSEIIWPWIYKCDFSHVLDLATGHGRNTQKLIDIADFVTVVDINEECIKACKERFGTLDNVHFVQNDGYTLSDIDNNSVTLVYSFDSAVHFELDVIKAYLEETFRVLVPGGLGFFHHSNFTEKPGADFRTNPHSRNFMSSQLFQHLAIRAGLKVVRSMPIGWGGGDRFVPMLDCLTLVKKPKS